MADNIPDLLRLPEDSFIGPQPPTMEEASQIVEAGGPAPSAELLGLPKPWEPEPAFPREKVKPVSKKEAEGLMAGGVSPEDVMRLVEDRRAAAAEQKQKDDEEAARELLKNYDLSTWDQFDASVEQANFKNAVDNYEPVDALEYYSDEELVKNKDFTFEGYVAQHPEVLQDREKTARLAELMRKRLMEPITAKDVGIGAAKLFFVQAPTQVWHLLKGVGTMIGDVAGAPLVAGAGAISGQGPEFQEELQNITEKNLASDLAGLEKGSYNFFSWAKRAPEGMLRRLGYDKWEDIPPERMQEIFRTRMEEFLQGEKIGRGEGEDPFFKAYTESVIEEQGPLSDERVNTVAQADPAGFLAFGMAFGAAGAVAKKAKAGVLESAAVKTGRELGRLREAVTKMRQTVPPSSEALKFAEKLLESSEKDVGAAGKALSYFSQQSAKAADLMNARLRSRVATEAAARLATPEAQAAAEAAQKSLAETEARIGPLGPSRAIAAARAIPAALNPASIAQRAAGRTLQGTGGFFRGAGKVARFAPPAAVAGVAAQQALAGNFQGVFYTLVGGRLLQAGRLGRALEAPLQRWGRSLSEAGRRVALNQPASMAQKAVIGLSRGSGEVVAGALKGMPMDVGFGLALAETPEDVRNLPAFGTAFGALSRGHRPIQRFTESVKLAPMEIRNPGRVRREAPGAPVRSAIDADRQGRQLLNPDGQARVNAIESFLNSVGSDTPVYVLPSAEAFRNVLVDQFRSRNGREPSVEEMADLENYSQQRGIFAENVRGDTGQEGTAVFITALEAAPHEGAHAFQYVLGDSGNQQIDQIIFDHYGPQWEQIGAQYTAQLLGTAPGENWRERLLPVVPESIKQQALNDPTVAADIYLAREIAAENFNTLFEATGGKPQGDPGLLYDLATAVDRTARFFGVNMFSRFSTPGQLGFGPEGATMEAIQEAARGRAPEVPPTSPGPTPGQRRPAPTGPPPRTPPGVPPVTQEQRDQVSRDAADIASQAPDTALPGATMTQREILGVYAEAIAKGMGVQTAYRSAPEAPGADVQAMREERRAEIEAARNIPEDLRRMVLNTGFPFKIEVSRNGVIQQLQWSPDMLMANAVRWGRALSDLAVKSPDSTALKKLESEGFTLDVANREWTADTWRKIINDAEVFAANQESGFTGSGERLQVPEELRGHGYFAPPETGTPAPLSQGAADFLNTLYNLRVPKTPAIARRGRLPANIAAQRVAEATARAAGLPEIGPEGVRRVSEPATLPSGEVRRRFGEVGRGGEEKARELGIEGQQILDPNPLRAEMERELQANSIPLPEGIEVIQRLNLEHIANVTLEPNLPRTAGGNTLTLQAGFLPKPAAGNVILYRGEEGAGATGGVWWTRNPLKAAQFAAGGRVSFLEVPQAAADAGKRAAERYGQGGDTYVLPAEMSKFAKDTGVELPVFDLEAQALPRRRGKTGSELYLEQLARKETSEAGPRQISRVERRQRYEHAIRVNRARQEALRQESIKTLREKAAQPGAELTATEEQRIAESTARPWKETAASRVIEERANPEEEILDFGAGKQAEVTKTLRSRGFKVTAHDFSQGPEIDPTALSRTYDRVMASNVLNVQGSNRMLADTISDLLRVSRPDTVVTANYPSEPRYFREEGYSRKENPMPASEMEKKLGQWWNKVERVGGTPAEPVWELSDPKLPEASPEIRGAVAESTGTQGELNLGVTELRKSGVPTSNDGGTSGGSSLQAMPREWSRWLSDYFLNNSAVKKAITPEERASFARGMELTAKMFGDFSSVPQEVPGDPIRDNSDPMFGLTFDLTTVCPKQDQLVKVSRQLETERGRIFTKQEMANIGELLRENGIATCYICYGQSARNAWGEAVQGVVDSINSVRRIDDWNKATPEQLDEVFGENSRTGELRTFLDENWQELKSLSEDLSGPEVRDWVLGEAPLEPGTFDDQIRSTVQRVAQGQVKANTPKPFSPYVDQLFGKGMKENIDFFNRIAGFRMNSQSDFRVWHVLDIAQFLGHLQSQGGMAHVYTRMEDFLRVFGKTGMKFNMSVEWTDPVNLPIEYRRGNLTYEEFKAARERHGDVEWDDMNSFPRARLEYWREQLPDDVGGMLVAATDYQLWEGLDNPLIDMIIPYHQGSVTPETTAFHGARDYTREQHHHFEKGWMPGESKTAKMSDGSKVTLVMGGAIKWGPKNARVKATVRTKGGKRQLVDQNGKVLIPDLAKGDAGFDQVKQKYGKKPGFKAEREVPLITREEHKNSRERYLELTRKMGITPKFERFSEHPNYMKLIRDAAREPMNQRQVDATKIDWTAAQEIVNRYVQGDEYKNERQANDGVLRFIRQRVEAKEWEPSRLVRARLTESVEEVMKITPQTLKKMMAKREKEAEKTGNKSGLSPEEIKTLKPPRSADDPSIEEQISEIKAKRK